MEKVEMIELDKLEKYLKEHNYHYERYDEEEDFYNRHQIIVMDEHGKRIWDVICHLGSYGYKAGKLEAMGSIVCNDDDDVEGWLTADDIIERLEAVL